MRADDPSAETTGRAAGDNQGHAADQDPVGRDASPPEVLDLRAVERDQAAETRDRTAAIRDGLATKAREGDPEILARLFAARDRAAAALDRYEAALDRHRAAYYLRHVYRDRLTGALQREAGHDRLLAEAERAHRRGESLVIAFVDVDHLKHVNDEHGHSAGDTLLESVGGALRASLRGYDVVVRYGGDEFVCALGETRLEEAELRMRAVQKTLDDASPGASISVGLALMQEGESLDAAVARADRDLYEHRAERHSSPGD
jgi:diguanylate cyclase (GGDEF)-like protein